MLVEDHLDTRQMYAEFLRERFDVRTAENGNLALGIMAIHRPDLLITDLSLPGMDGIELVSRVRKDPALQALPVICLSGYGGHVYEVRAREVGCDRLIQKPCLPDALAAIVDEVLGEIQGRMVAGRG